MTSLTSDELESVSAALCAKNPGVNRQELTRLVYDVYQELASHARITTHLIPLTLNVSRRRLAAKYRGAPSTGSYNILQSPPVITTFAVAQRGESRPGLRRWSTR